MLSKITNLIKMKPLFSILISKLLPLLFVSTLMIIVVGCKKDLQNTQNEIIQPQNKLRNIYALNYEDDLKIEFSKILAKALKDDVDLRNSIKKEANYQFDLDYDILYQSIKGKIISNNETFREKLLKYCTEELLREIEQNNPLLTIFIPELPSGWSSISWKTDTEIPLVCPAIQSNEKEAIYYDSDSVKYKVSTEMVPGFPVVAVKTNERLVVQNASIKTVNTSKAPDIVTDQFSYNFGSIYFDPRTKNDDPLVKEQLSPMPTKRPISQISASTERLINLNNNDDLLKAFRSGAAWQRDYLYYGLTPTDTVGRLNAGRKEYIRWIKFKDPELAYMQISDQYDQGNNDPKYNSTRTSSMPIWTDGIFEFKFTFFINSTRGTGSTIDVIAPVRPERLFVLNYRRVIGGLFYTFLSFVNNIECDINLPIAAWDIGSTGYTWKVRMSEMDLSTTVTNTYTHTTEYAGNVSFNLAFGEDEKHGLGFGGSAKKTSTQSYTVTTQQGDDDLGETELRHSDKIISSLSSWDQYTTSAYLNGYENGYMYFWIVPR